jgi:hypothetical protein
VKEVGSNFLGTELDVLVVSPLTGVNHILCCDPRWYARRIMQVYYSWPVPHSAEEIESGARMFESGAGTRQNER